MRQSEKWWRRFYVVVAFLCCTQWLMAQGFLRAKDSVIVDGKGQPIILRGMGLGGWMLQEGYMFQLSNLGQQYRIRQMIEEAVGPEKTKAFYDAWLTNHTTKKDIDSLAAWGFNSIRLPMHFALYTLPVEEEPVAGKNTWLTKGFALTDSLLRWCGQNKIYLILDMHASPGGQGNDLPIADRNAAKPSLWESEANKQKMISLWTEIAKRYAKEKWIGGYDLINEPNWGFEDPKDKRGTAEKKNEPLKRLLVDVTHAIRSVDSNHLIIVEGNGFGNNYGGILPAWDNNMALSFHKYGNYNTRSAIESFLTLRTKYHVPLWLGESGENSNTWFTEAIQLAEQNGIGWAWWQEKKMGINNPLEIKEPANYERLLRYASGKGAKPSADSAWKILGELLENIKIENNIFHPDVIDAMFRQVRSANTKPFKLYVLKDSITIEAVHYDLGRQRSAYFDKDSASYQYTPGVNTRGNKGYQFRNDGVDIDADNAGYYVSEMEEGEWLQYTIEVAAGGDYKLSFDITPVASSASVSIKLNGKTLGQPFDVHSLINDKGEAPSFIKTHLSKGFNKIVIQAEKGKFNLRSFTIVRS